MPREGHADIGITLSESDGVRYLHFGTEWVQGAMRLARPHRLELEYQQQMMSTLLFVPEPDAVLQLGLGAGALTKFCHRTLPGARMVAVEIDPRVVGVARRHFGLPPDDARLRVLTAEAGAYVRGAPASADWIHVDCYDAAARGPVLDSLAFYRACRRALRPGGVAAFNLFGGQMAPSVAAIGSAFDRGWIRLPRSSTGNTIVLAFAADHPEWVIGDLRRRAQVLERRLRLPYVDWLEGMRDATGRRLGTA